jgi:hypothetical protein
MRSEDQPAIALSVRQPWATLLVCGIKTVEVRAWPTDRRGRILIHAAKTVDERRIGWDLVPNEFEEMARRRGGIIGSCRLTDCIAYPSKKRFAADRRRHCNDPSWFREPVLYGFVFTRPAALPFRRYPGWVRFFSVIHDTPPHDDPNQFPEFLEMK